MRLIIALKSACRVKVGEENASRMSGMFCFENRCQIFKHPQIIAIMLFCVDFENVYFLKKRFCFLASSLKDKTLTFSPLDMANMSKGVVEQQIVKIMIIHL